jgi:hypothetical protein
LALHTVLDPFQLALLLAAHLGFALLHATCRSRIVGPRQ